MRCRIVNMKNEYRESLGVYLWQCFDVIEIRIERSGWKYPRETKWVYCVPDGTPCRRFLWYEVELLEK